jgi:hypothetical protein
MSHSSFHCRRAIYLFDLPRERVEGVLTEHAPSGGKKKRLCFALSPREAGWLLVGVPDEIPSWSVFELAVSFFDVDDDDFDLARLASEPEIPDDSILVVQMGTGRPDECYYALNEPNVLCDALFVGRRDDGKGLRIDIIEEIEKIEPESARFSLSVIEYLTSRGVPGALLPTESGFAFVPEQLFERMIHF